MNEIDYMEEDLYLAWNLYFDYYDRKSEADHSFQPHPLLMAHLAAYEKYEETKEKVVHGIGMGYFDESGIPHEAYKTTITVDGDSFQIGKFIDITNEQEIPFPLVIRILYVSMMLDHYESATIPIEDAVNILNQVIPFLNFELFDNNEAQNAINHFVKKLENGEIINPGLVAQFNDLLNKKISWDKYPPQIRSMIASIYSFRNKDITNFVCITSVDDRIQSYKVLEQLKMAYLSDAYEPLRITDFREPFMFQKILGP